MNQNPLGHATPTMRNLRPASDPGPQVAACTALREELLMEVDRVTTMLPKRGGVAIMVGWIRNCDRTQTPVEGPFYIHPNGEMTGN